MRPIQVTALLVVMSTLMQNGLISDTRGPLMRTTVTIDDELYAKALEMADP